MQSKKQSFIEAIKSYFLRTTVSSPCSCDNTVVLHDGIVSFCGNCGDDLE